MPQGYPLFLGQTNFVWTKYFKCIGCVCWVSICIKLPERSFCENLCFIRLAVDMLDSDQKAMEFKVTKELESKNSSLPLVLLFLVLTSFDAMLVMIYTRVSNLREL